LLGCCSILIITFFFVCLCPHPIFEDIRVVIGSRLVTADRAEAALMVLAAAAEAAGARMCGLNQLNGIFLPLLLLLLCCCRHTHHCVVMRRSTDFKNLLGLQGTSRGPPGELQETSRGPPGEVQGRSRGGPGEVQGRSRGGPGEVQGSSRGPSGDLQGTFRGPPGDLQETSRGPPATLITCPIGISNTNWYFKYHDLTSE
jgi:hypothetical protein